MDLADAFTVNAPYVAGNSGPYRTALAPLDELAFRQWVAADRIPFDPNAARADYDMRGFWKAAQSPAQWDFMKLAGRIPADIGPAGTRVDPNDGLPHFPDYWKTPYHETFSGESKFAGPIAPMWNAQDQLIAPSGRILFDDRKRRADGPF